jgi:hypothetical protein
MSNCAYTLYLITDTERTFLQKAGQPQELCVPKSTIKRWANQMSVTIPKHCSVEIEDPSGKVIGKSPFGSSRLRWVIEEVKHEHHAQPSLIARILGAN